MIHFITLYLSFKLIVMKKDYQYYLTYVKECLDQQLDLNNILVIREFFDVVVVAKEEAYDVTPHPCDAMRESMITLLSNGVLMSIKVTMSIGQEEGLSSSMQVVVLHVA